MSRLQHVNKSKKIPKRSRTIPYPQHKDYGDGKNVGKLFRCWNCGFLCNTDINALGGADEFVQIKPVAYTQTDQYGDEVYHCEGYAGADQTTCEAAGGTWTSTAYKPGDILVGCPQCGSINYRGDY
jgi:hypothetical protein